jgi:uncharacterized protein
MSDGILTKFLSQYKELRPEKATIIWHGGEPTLAGIQFYRKAIALEKKLWAPNQVRNLIQTNATTINSEWAVFLEENNFGVGVSLDGCRESHGLYRHTVKGENSFDLTMHGIEVLKQAGINPGYIQTVTKAKLGAAIKDFDFFHESLEASHWSYNVFLDLNNGAMSELNVSPDAWYDYVNTIINLWLANDDSKLIIREVETIVQGASGKTCRACRNNGSCGHYFCLEPDGTIYPCDRFINKEYCWGSLSDDNLEIILAGEKRRFFLQENRKSYENCVGCNWFTACHNGCGSHRVGGLSGKFYYCKSMKLLFGKMAETIEEFRSERR